MALKLYSGTNSAIKVYASDWRLFVKELKKRGFGFRETEEKIRNL